MQFGNFLGVVTKEGQILFSTGLASTVHRARQVFLLPFSFCYHLILSLVMLPLFYVEFCLKI